MVLGIDVGVNLFRVNVVHTHTCPIVPHDLTLKAELAVAHRPNKAGLSLSSRLFLLGQRVSGRLNCFWVDYLGWSEVLEYVILDLEQVNCEFFVQ